MNRQPTKWEKVFTKHIPLKKGLDPEYIKSFYQINRKRKKFFLNEQTTQISTL